MEKKIEERDWPPLLPRLERPLAFPLNSHRMNELIKWLTPDRIRMGYSMAKEVMAEWSDTPALDIRLTIGVSRQTVYNWMNGVHRPSRAQVAFLDYVFSDLLGVDWPTRVDQRLTGQQG